MVVKRIVANIAAAPLAPVKAFYADLFELDVVMDHGWIVTLASGETARTQISIASEGGAGAAVPELSIEVDDVDAVYARAKRLGCPIAYEIADEAWGVRRFFVTDPTGKLINVLAHPA